MGGGFFLASQSTVAMATHQATSTAPFIILHRIIEHPGYPVPCHIGKRGGKAQKARQEDRLLTAQSQKRASKPAEEGIFLLGEWVQASLRKQGWELGLDTHIDICWVAGGGGGDLASQK